MRLVRSLVGGLATVALGLIAAGDEGVHAQSTVFTSGEAEYRSIRIPSLVCATDGTLLAFAEGRRIPSDHGQNDIILKRSADGGATWGDLIFVHADETKVFVNPCAVVLDSGRVLLMYQEFPVGFHARRIGNDVQLLEPGVTGDRISRTLVQSSDDNGATWSEPRDVTRQTKRPVPIVSTASGPGIGIVLRRGTFKGRILIPTNEGWWVDEDRRIFNVFACYSDDNGETWAVGEPAPRTGGIEGDEVQMVELSNGDVLLNSRNALGTHRVVARSSDGGATWTELAEDDELPEPRCMGTVLRYSWPEDGRSRILYAGPAEEDDRKRGTVRVSYDEGASWQKSRVIVEEFYAYSCLTRLAGGDIGLLYEAADYGRIDFIRVGIDWAESP